MVTFRNVDIRQCPTCISGRYSRSPLRPYNVGFPVMSHHDRISICSVCGTREAYEEYMSSRASRGDTKAMSAPKGGNRMQ